MSSGIRCRQPVPGHQDQGRSPPLEPETIGTSSTSNSRCHPSLPDSIHDPGLGGIVGRHLHLDLVTHHQANEPLPHLAGNMRQHFVVAGELHLEHCPSEHGRNGTLHFNGLVLTVSSLPGALVFTPAPSASTSAPSSSWWSCDNSFLGSASTQSAHPLARIIVDILKVAIEISPPCPDFPASSLLLAKLCIRNDSLRGGMLPRGLALTPGRLAPSLPALPASEQTLLKRL